jgi:hypothetical protein
MGYVENVNVNSLLIPVDFDIKIVHAHEAFRRGGGHA